MKEEKYNSPINQARRDYPGAAIDAADDNRVERNAVKNRTRTQNNNPRNDSGPRADINS